MSIITKSNKKNDVNPEGREVETETPELISAETLADAVAVQGEDLCLAQIKAQLTIGFRSHVRGKLESMTDDENTFTVEDILAMDFSDWKPEARTRKTAEEKAAALLSTLDPKTLEAVLANYCK